MCDWCSIGDDQKFTLHKIHILDARERIECAAIKKDGKVYVVPRPGRHHDVIHHMIHEVGLPNAHGEQGFTTNYERFVNRTHGKQIAKKAQQLLKRASPNKHLFSEDLWSGSLRMTHFAEEEGEKSS